MPRSKPGERSPRRFSLNEHKMLISWVTCPQDGRATGDERVSSSPAEGTVLRVLAVQSNPGIRRETKGKTPSAGHKKGP